MLAYVFWHRPRGGVTSAEYERRLRAFHGRMVGQSASFRVDELPFAAGEGYEDWYLVEDWAELGALNAAAVSDERRAPHDGVAEIAGDGWGGVYALVRGVAEPPLTARWVSKPAGDSYEAFLDAVHAPTVWQRQMVLGPAPEFCVVEGEDIAGQRHASARVAIQPDPASASATSAHQMEATAPRVSGTAARADASAPVGVWDSR